MYVFVPDSISYDDEDPTSVKIFKQLTDFDGWFSFVRAYDSELALDSKTFIFVRMHADHIVDWFTHGSRLLDDMEIRLLSDPYGSHSPMFHFAKSAIKLISSAEIAEAWRLAQKDQDVKMQNETEEKLLKRNETVDERSFRRIDPRLKQQKQLRVQRLEELDDAVEPEV